MPLPKLLKSMYSFNTMTVIALIILVYNYRVHLIISLLATCVSMHIQCRNIEKKSSAIIECSSGWDRLSGLEALG